MDTADKIGLPWYVGWLTDNTLLASFLWCLAITIGMMALIALVLESRWLPLNPKRQFLSFFPGDIFLSAMTAGLLVLARDLPAEDRWYNSDPLHGLTQAATLAAAVMLTIGEGKQGMYRLRALLSPTKLYHNVILYGLFAYLAATTLVAVLFGSAWSWAFALKLAGCLACGLVWLVLVLKENTLGTARLSVKAASAHTDDWQPIWVGWRRLFTRP